MEEMNDVMNEALEQSVEPEIDSSWEEETFSTDETSAREEQNPADQPELFTLKNRDETRQVTREELIAMAQKGWDYDSVRQERDQLRQYRRTVEQFGPGQAVPKAETLMQQVKVNARRQDMDRFLNAYPDVKAETIPREVWSQVARGMPLVSAYAMHENQQLKVQLAAERQNQINRTRTPGGLSTNAGSELDEMDRMWAEED